MDVMDHIDEELEKFFQGFAWKASRVENSNKASRCLDHVIEAMMQTKHNIHKMIVDLEKIRALCLECEGKEPVKKEVPKAAVPKGPVKKTPRMVQPVKKKK